MRPRHILSLAFVAVVLILGAWSFWGNVVEPHPGGAPVGTVTSPAAEASPLPSSIAGLSLASSVEGVEAVTAVEQLHGKPLGAGLDDAWVGEYRGSGSATVWVSRSAVAEDAEELLVRMTDLIAEGGSPFTGLTPIEEGGTDGYRLEGMGQVHFYFLEGRDLYWLAIDAPLEESGLDDLLAGATDRT